MTRTPPTSTVPLEDMTRFAGPHPPRGLAGHDADRNRTMEAQSDDDWYEEDEDEDDPDDEEDDEDDDEEEEPEWYV